MVDRPPPRLCVFVRAPVPGHVKSRLAGQIGTQAAFEANCILTERILDALADISLCVELWVAGDTDNCLIRQWAGRFNLAVRSQPPGDLGWKMHRALEHCHACGGAGMVIGSDLPAVDAAYIERATALLASHDAVLGPAEDGGYALIGLHRPNAAIFTGIDWSTDAVCTQTRAKLNGLGLSVGELPTTWDVDTLADWRRFLANRGRKIQTEPLPRNLFN